jgi:hypothetical protein
MVILGDSIRRYNPILMKECTFLYFLASIYNLFHKAKNVATDIAEEMCPKNKIWNPESLEISRAIHLDFMSFSPCRWMGILR